MRYAFTMIELIFVIVILGILASVAIPRLNATRNDAKVSTMAMEIVNAANEIAAYAVANGRTEDNLSVMSNSIKHMFESGVAENISVKRVGIDMGIASPCVIIDINTTSSSEILNIVLENSGSDETCDALQKIIHVEDYPIKLRGSSVVR